MDIKKDDEFSHVNLGKYIKEEHRDLTYFKGIDFHQDIIDFPDRDPDFITAYIYLDKADTKTSPLYLIPNSFKLGATSFPHNLKFKKNNVYYKSNKKNITSKAVMLSGQSEPYLFGTHLYYMEPNLMNTQLQEFLLDF